jgi:hypothetical protein
VLPSGVTCGHRRSESDGQGNTCALGLVVDCALPSVGRCEAWEGPP